MLVKICWGHSVRCRDAPRAGCEVGAGDTDRSRSGNVDDMPSIVLLVNGIRRLMKIFFQSCVCVFFWAFRIRCIVFVCHFRISALISSSGFAV